MLTGVGNIYADERFVPRRDPSASQERAVSPAPSSNGLRFAPCGKVLQSAIQLGGSSVSDYVDANGVKGFFQLEHCVYMRTGEPCYRHCQSPHSDASCWPAVGTHFCPNCQKLEPYPATWLLLVFRITPSTSGFQNPENLDDLASQVPENKMNLERPVDC